MVISFCAVLFGLPQRVPPKLTQDQPSASKNPPLDARGSSLPKYAYFVSCSGSFAKLDTQTNKIVSHGNVLTPGSLSALDIENSQNIAGCLINNLQYSLATQLVYAAVPTRGSDSSYLVAAFRMPDFKLVAKTGPFTSLPNLLLSSDGVQLSVEDENQRLIYQARDLNLIGPADVRPALGVSSAAHWTDGTVIDANQVFSDQGQLLRRVDGNALLTPILKQKWGTLQRDGVNGKSYIPISYADSDDGRMIFVAGNDMPADQKNFQSGIVVYDVSTDKILGTALIPFRAAGADPTHFDTPTIHLVPFHNWMVVEDYGWSSSTSSTDSAQVSNEYFRFKTGKLVLCNVKDGSVLRIFQLAPAPGVLGRVIGFSPEGRFLYYGSSERIYTVDLNGEQPIDSVEIKNFSPNQGFPPLALFLNGQ